MMSVYNANDYIFFMKSYYFNKKWFYNVNISDRQISLMLELDIVWNKLTYPTSSSILSMFMKKLIFSISVELEDSLSQVSEIPIKENLMFKLDRRSVKLFKLCERLRILRCRSEKLSPEKCSFLSCTIHLPRSTIHIKDLQRCHWRHVAKIQRFKSTP